MPKTNIGNDFLVEQTERVGNPQSKGVITKAGDKPSQGITIKVETYNYG